MCLIFDSVDSICTHTNEYQVVIGDSFFHLKCPGFKILHNTLIMSGPFCVCAFVCFVCSSATNSSLLLGSY